MIVFVFYAVKAGFGVCFDSYSPLVLQKLFAKEY